MVLERTRIGRQMRLHRGSIHTFELAPLVRALRAEEDYREYGRDGVTLVKTPELRSVLEVLAAGMGLEEHQEPGPITLQILDGELRFQAADEILYLRAGEILTLPTIRRHSVEAVTDSAFLLSLGVTNGCEATTRHSAPEAQPGDAAAAAQEIRQIRREWPTAQERFKGEWSLDAQQQ